MVGKYKAITLCGSTRFKEAFMEEQKRLTLEGNMYEMTEDFFSIFTRFLGWKNLGNVLGAGKEAEARMLGASIK